MDKLTSNSEALCTHSAPVPSRSISGHLSHESNVKIRCGVQVYPVDLRKGGSLTLQLRNQPVLGQYCSSIPYFAPSTSPSLALIETGHVLCRVQLSWTRPCRRQNSRQTLPNACPDGPFPSGRRLRSAFATSPQLIGQLIVCLKNLEERPLTASYWYVWI